MRPLFPLCYFAGLRISGCSSGATSQFHQRPLAFRGAVEWVGEPGRTAMSHDSSGPWGSVSLTRIFSSSWRHFVGSMQPRVFPILDAIKGGSLNSPSHARCLQTAHVTLQNSPSLNYSSGACRFHEAPPTASVPPTRPCLTRPWPHLVASNGRMRTLSSHRRWTGLVRAGQCLLPVLKLFGAQVFRIVASF